MKRKLFSFIFALTLILPCAILFSACGDDDDSVKTIKSIAVNVKNEEYVYENGVLTFTYGEDIDIQKSDFEVKKIFDDESSEVTDEYTLTLPEEFSQNVIPVGDDYVITFTYDMEGDNDITATINVEIKNIEVDKPIINNTLVSVTEFNGEAQNIEDLILGSSNSELATLKTLITSGIVELKTIENDVNSKLTALTAGTYTFQIVPADNFAWAGNSTAINCSWMITKKTILAPTLQQTNFYYQHEWNEVQEKFEGISQTAQINSSYVNLDLLDLSGDISKENAGSYQLIASIKDEYKNNYAFAGNQSSVTLNWNIAPMVVNKVSILSTSYEYTGNKIEPLTLNAEQTKLIKATLSDNNPVNVGTYTYTIDFNLDNIENRNNYVWVEQGNNLQYTITYNIVDKAIGIDSIAWSVNTSQEYNGQTYDSKITTISDEYLEYKVYYKQNEHEEYQLINTDSINSGYYKTIAIIKDNLYLYLNSDVNKTPILESSLIKEWRIVEKVISNPTLTQTEFDFSHTWDNTTNKFVGEVKTANINNGYGFKDLIEITNNINSNAGDYTAVIKLKDEYKNNYSFSNGADLIELGYSINPMKIIKPELDVDEYVYTGEVINPLNLTGDISKLLSVSLNDSNPINVGEYTYTISFNEENVESINNYLWHGEDSLSDYQISYNIIKRVLTESDFSWDYLEPFVYDGELKVVEVVCDFDVELDVVYIDNEFDEVGEYTAIAEISIMYNDDNFEIDGILELTLDWEIVKPNPLDSVIINTKTYTYDEFKNLEYLIVGSTITFNTNEGFSILVDDVETTEFVVSDTKSHINIKSNDDEFSKTYTVALTEVLVNGNSIGYAGIMNRELTYELGKNETEITITVDNSLVNNVYYRARDSYQLLTSNTITVSNLGSISFNKQQSEDYYETLFHINIKEYSVIKEFNVTTYDYIQGTSSTSNMKARLGINSWSIPTLSESIITNMGVVFKDEYASTYTYTITDKDGNSIDLTKMENFVAFITVKDGDEVVEVSRIGFDYNVGMYILDQFTNIGFDDEVYYVYSQAPTISAEILDREYQPLENVNITIDGVESYANSTAGIVRKPIVVTFDIDDTIYTYTRDIIINNSDSISDYCTNVCLQGEALGTIELDPNVGNKFNTALSPQIWHQIKGNSSIINCESEMGYMLDSCEPKYDSTNRVAYVEIIVSSEENPDETYTLYIYLPIIGQLNNDTTIKVTETSLSDSTHLVDKTEMFNSNTISLTNYNSNYVLEIETNNERAIIDFNNGAIIESENITLSFTKAGEYTLKIIATDGTERIITITVEGEFAPMLYLKYNDTTLTMDIDMNNGQPIGNMQMIMDEFYNISFIGYLGEAEVEVGEGLECVAKSSVANTITDKDGNPIQGLTSSDSNITLTVQEDTDGSISGVENTKYVMVIANVNVGGDVIVVPVYFLLCEQPTE